MSTEREHERVPELLLERLAAGELPEELRRELLHRLEQEPAGSRRLAALQASNRAILDAHPPARVAAEIERRHGRRRGRERVRWVTGLAGAAAAALCLVLVSPRLFPRTDPNLGLRPKGDPMLAIYRKGDSGVEQLRAGATVRSRDLLQISYTSAGFEHGVIFSVDGGGGVTLHFPRTRTDSTRLEGEPRLLPYAYELDDAPGYERFFFVVSRQPLDAEQILRRGQTLGADPRRSLSLPAGAGAVELLLLKPSLKVPR